MSVLASYLGRTVDLAAYQGVFPASAAQRLTAALAGHGSGGTVVTGVQKVVNRFLVIFGTRKGSIRYLPTFGTNFITRAQLGVWRTVADVQLDFAASRLDLLRQLQAVETPSDPPEERTVDIRLLAVQLSGLSVSVRIALTTAAGEPVPFVVPIDTGLH